MSNDDLYGDDFDLAAFGDDDDLFGDDDELGAAAVNRKAIRRLLIRRKRLIAKLPALPAQQRKVAKARIAKINSLLAKAGYNKVRRRSADAMAASGVEGVGSLGFTVNSPPGLGRLVRLPFYANITPVPATIITAAGQAVVSATNPIIYTSQTAGFAGGTAYQMQTPQISWATLRIVGFEVSQRQQANLIGNNTGGAATDDGEVGPAVIAQDLQIGGGANLFTHEDFADASIYDSAQPEFAGLRDYPVLKSPNTSTVVVNQVGVIDAAGRYRVTFSAALLCEVLIDDEFGAHIPGAYARKGALVRQGGSFT